MSGSVATDDHSLTGRVIVSGISPGAGESTGVPRVSESIGEDLVRVGEGTFRVPSVILAHHSMKKKSRKTRLDRMVPNTVPGWTFLTNHAQVLVCIARDPGIRLRDIGERIGITERAAHRIVVELADAGYITRERNGRRNRYTINAHFPLPDPVAREQNLGELLAILTGAPQTKRAGRSRTSR
jgi:MarR family